MDRRTFIKSSVMSAGVAMAGLNSSRSEPAPASTAPAIELMNARNVTLRSSRAKTIHLAGKGTREVRVFQTDSKISADPDVSKDAIIRQ